MFIDTVLYALIGAYLQAVLPTQEFGVPRPWYFPVSDVIALSKQIVTFMCYRTITTEKSASVVVKSHRQKQKLRPKLCSRDWFLSFRGAKQFTEDTSLLSRDDENEAIAETNRFFQPLDSNLQAKLREGRCVSVRGLRKEFDTDKGVKVAVKLVLLVARACVFPYRR